MVVVRKHIWMLVLVLAIPLVIAACDGDDDGVVTPVPPPGTAVSSTGVWVVADNGTLSAANAALFIADNTYFNVHSLAFSGGEIRGQIDHTPTVVKFASLDGAQDNNPAVTARGAGVVAFDNTGVDNTIAGFVVTNGSAATATINAGARGATGPVIVTLVGGPSHWFIPDNTTLSAANLANLNADNTYFDVGTIRGQIDKTPTTTTAASLNGAQEVPPNGSAAKGAGVAAFNAADNTIAGFIVTTNLTATQAHIHQGARGVAGGILVPLFGGPSHWFFLDNATLPADNVAAFLGDNTYYNVHSVALPGGEIRGQLDKTPNLVKFAALDNTQETPASQSTAKGGGILAYDGTLTDNNVAGFVVTTGITGTAAHVHNAARGVAGPIILPLLPSP
jgi:hypothetical protein